MSSKGGYNSTEVWRKIFFRCDNLTSTNKCFLGRPDESEGCKSEWCCLCCRRYKKNCSGCYKLREIKRRDKYDHKLRQQTEFECFISKEKVKE